MVTPDVLDAKPLVAICDAEETETALLRSILGGAGYPFFVIEDPEAVVDHLLRTTAEAVFLNTPFGDKFDIIESIRQNRDLSDISIFLLVPETDATDEDIQEAWNAGIDVYLKKPIGKEQVLMFLDLAIRTRRGEDPEALTAEWRAGKAAPANG